MSWSTKKILNAFTSRGRALVGRLDPRRTWRSRAYRAQRALVEGMLAGFSRDSGRRFDGTVLVDGSWDNPNHWVRYALLRKALGLAGGHEVGLVGPYRVQECRQTFERLGIREVLRFDARRGDLDRYRREALLLLAGTKAPQDILFWHLPDGFPADFIYDGLLKRQRTACVDLTDRRLPGYVAEALGSLGAAEELLGARDFTLLALSHAVNFQYASLAWMAIRRGIPVVVLYGEFGVLRFVKLNKPEDLWTATNRPNRSEFESLSQQRADALATAGLLYLHKRRTGGTKELAATLAFQKRTQRVDRYSVCEQFGWDPKRPILAVYAPNWFDLPHMYGMSHFRDFLDWLETTLSAAVTNRSVNWLFKAHPCDGWYRGVTLSDLMPAISQAHVQLVPDQWNGSSVMDSVDGLVTYHGTAGIEFAALGKPVLLADRGWYHELGIAKWPRSRDEYVHELTSEWWKGLDLSETARRARILAGWHFCRPAWQGAFVLEDDPVQDPIYERIPVLLAGSGEVIERELRTIGDWFYAPHRHYHTYKMSLADECAF